MARVSSLTAPRPARSSFYLTSAIAFLLVAIAGFSTTYWLPLARGTFAGPAIAHVHGATLFGWLLLFIVQATLARSHSMRVHRRVGWIGAALAAGIVVSGVTVGAYAARRDLAGGETWPYAAFVNIVIEMMVFGSLVGAAIAMRRHPEAHKRLLVLATISALGPAWFRFRHFMPFVPNPLVTFSLIADCVLLIFIVRDLRTTGRVHPVYVWAGSAMVLVHVLELASDGSEAWVRVGRWLLGGGTA